MAWIKYTGVTRVEVIPEDSVAISPRGAIAFSATLRRPVFKNHFCEIEYDDETQRLRLTLVREGSSRSYCFRDDEGRYRVEPIGAMKLWKLRPAERILCAARWEDDALIVQLPGGKAPKSEKPPEVPNPESKPPRKQRAARAVQTPSGRPYCICSACGNRYPLVERPSGNYPYGHRVNGKVCPGSLRAPLPLEADYGEDE